MRIKKSINDIKCIFEVEGFKLLSDKYENNRTKLKGICPKNHKFEITWHGWIRGHRCKFCAFEDRTAQRRLSIDFIDNEFKKEGYILLSKNYVNNLQSLKFICPNNHNGTISWGSWSQGHRCRECAYKNVSGNQKQTIDFIKKSFNREEYTLLSTRLDYNSNKKSKLDFICSEGHKGKILWNNWQQGGRCRICATKVSNGERGIFEFLNKLISVESINRKIISPLELDIVIPSKKIAIEYCGLYWHSESMGKDKHYHLNKLKRCNEQGYKLITIFEDEWLHKKDIVKSRLKNILGLNNKSSIYARKCKIIEIDSSVKNRFLNKNHLQGSDKSSIKLGAFYNNELISVMTFSKPNIAKGRSYKRGVYELNRFCSDSNYRVVGIASKLFKYFINNYKFTEIFTYGDKRWSTGDLYKNLNFVKDEDSKPSYWYIEKGKRIHRFNFRKSILKNKLEKFNKKLTEYENMKINGYHRIYDCGNTKWIYINVEDK